MFIYWRSYQVSNSMYVWRNINLMLNMWRMQHLLLFLYLHLTFSVSYYIVQYHCFHTIVHLTFVPCWT